MNEAESYDEIAREVFLPLFEVIAGKAVQLSGKEEGKCLDLGCGGGMFGYHILKQSQYHITFVDKQQEAIEICKARGKEWGLSDRVRTITSEVKKMPLEDNEFDLIVSRGSVGFWGEGSELEEVFKEIYRVLAPYGIAVIGHSLGTPSIKEEIVKKMKVYRPDWPSRVNRMRHKLSFEDYKALLEKNHIVSTVLHEDWGDFIIIHKGEGAY